MNALEGLQVSETHASYRPEGNFTFDEALDLVAAAIAFARENQIKKLLVDTTKLTAIEPPSTWERFRMAVRLAGEARWTVKIALVARAAHIDPNRFGMTVARNRGLVADVFESEKDALAWLLDATR